MKQILSVGVMALLALAGCGSNSHLLAPDPEARQMISPEVSEGECTPCVDPVCGGLTCNPGGSWRSRHCGVDYLFDCEGCKANFDLDPVFFAGR